MCRDIILFHGSCKNGFLKRFIRCVNAKRRAHILRAIWTLSCRRHAYVNPFLDASVCVSSFGRYHVNVCTAFFERYRYLEDARLPCVCFGRYLRVALCMIQLFTDNAGLVRKRSLRRRFFDDNLLPVNYKSCSYAHELR